MIEDRSLTSPAYDEETDCILKGRQSGNTAREKNLTGRLVL
jgi:hypothetical protein